MKALDAFEKVLSLDPSFTLAFGHIFDIYADEELFERGIETAENLLAADPNNSGVYGSLGKLYRDMGGLRFLEHTRLGIYVQQVLHAHGSGDDWPAGRLGTEQHHE